MNCNKRILGYCPNYYNIVNFEFREDDLMSEKLIKVYKSCIFSADINSSEDINTIQKLDRVFSNYINDYLFRNTLQKEIRYVKIKRDSNIAKSLAESIIKIFIRYEEYTTRKIYLSKWI